MAPNYGAVGPYYSIITQGDTPGSQSFTWSDPVMNTLFNPADAVSYTQPTFSANLDVQGTGTEGLPPVDAAGALPLATPLFNPVFTTTTAVDNIGDLEHSFASLGGGVLGSTSTTLSATETPVTSSPSMPGTMSNSILWTSANCVY